MPQAEKQRLAICGYTRYNEKKEDLRRINDAVQCALCGMCAEAVYKAAAPSAGPGKSACLYEGDSAGILSRFLISVTDLVEETEKTLKKESNESTSVEDKPMDMKGFHN